MLRLVVVVCALVSVIQGRYDPEEVLDLFEGDIELPQRSGFRNALSDKSKLWPNGQVAYEIDDPKDTITEDQHANLTKAMQILEKKTCIRFHENKDPEVNNFLKIQKSKAGCSSNVGMMDGSKMTKFRGQTVRLSDECFEIGKITHEIMHSLGFFHEQSRGDRDDYVRIVPQNIEQGKLRQFRKYDKSKENLQLGAPYDYGSLMHYPKWAFSSKFEKDTIIPIYEAEIGQRRALSEIDIWKINKLYNCPNLGPVPKVVRIPKPKEVERPFNAERSFNCDFDYFYACDFRDEMSNTIDWQVGKGQTSKYFETGPKKDANGEDCCYIYMSVITHKVGDQGSLVTPVMQPTMDEGSCFSFKYHMYGNTIGSLEVFWRPLGTNEEHILFKETGNQGEKWLKKHFVLNMKQEFEIVFRGTVGGDDFSTYEGNIALDDVVIVPMIRLRIKGKKCGE